VQALHLVFSLSDRRIRLSSFYLSHRLFPQFERDFGGNACNKNRWELTEFFFGLGAQMITPPNIVFRPYFSSQDVFLKISSSVAHLNRKPRSRYPR
jgi:hypothetical protein